MRCANARSADAACVRMATKTILMAEGMERIMETIQVNEIELSRSSWHVNYFSQIKIVLFAWQAMARQHFIESAFTKYMPKA